MDDKDFQSFVIVKLNSLDEKTNGLAIVSGTQTVILEQQSEILSRNTDSLEEHMKRTDILEKHVAVTEAKITSSWKTVKVVVMIIGSVLSLIGIGGLVAMARALLGV